MRQTALRPRFVEFIPEQLEDGVLRAQVRAGSPGLHVLTADVAFAGRELKQWTEALVRVR